MAATAATAGTAPGGRAGPAPLDRRRTFAFFCMVFGMFMAILDIQIVSASLAEIQAGLSASSDEISWVQTSYLIAEVIMIPLSGMLSRVLSTRWMFVIASGGFTFMSFMCATATNIDQMIVYRALQGFIGGGMIPTVFASAFTIFPPEKRPIISPIIGLVATLAPTIGPTLGGYLTDLFSWHWLFLVNIVPGILVTVSTYLLVDFDEPDLSLLKSFDWVGLAGMAAFLGSPGVRARGRAEQRLVPGRGGGDPGGGQRRRRASCSSIAPSRPAADRRPARLRRPEFRGRLRLQLRHGHRALRADLSLPGLPGAGAGLLVPADRRDDVRVRRCDVPDGADRRPAVAQHGPAPDDGDRVRVVRDRNLDDHGPHEGLGLLGTVRTPDLARRRA